MGEVIHAPPVRNRLFKCQGKKGEKVVLTLEKFHLNEVSKWSWQLLTNGSFISPAPPPLHMQQLQMLLKGN